MSLNKDASLLDWIKDFQQSDDPKFEGKSKELRRKIAIGAYYSMQKESLELTEGADIYCPHCGENHGKASEYTVNHGGAKRVQFCGTCGYDAKKESKPKSGKTPLHMHQGLSAEGAEKVKSWAKENGATDIDHKTYQAHKPASLRATVTKHSVYYRHPTGMKYQYDHFGPIKESVELDEVTVAVAHRSFKNYMGKIKDARDKGDMVAAVKHVKHAVSLKSRLDRKKSHAMVIQTNEENIMENNEEPVSKLFRPSGVDDALAAVRAFAEANPLPEQKENDHSYVRMSTRLAGWKQEPNDK